LRGVIVPVIPILLTTVIIPSPIIVPITITITVVSTIISRFSTILEHMSSNPAVKAGSLESLIPLLVIIIISLFVRAIQGW
jgi:hypothetical protein